MAQKRPTARTRSKRKGKVTSLSTRFEPEFWGDLDQRLNISKAIRERYETLIKETGANSLAKRLLVQRAVFLSIRIETMETTAASTGEFNQSVYTFAVNALSGLLTKLGLDVDEGEVLTLKDYVATKG